MMGCHNIYILVHMLWDTIVFKCASPQYSRVTPHGCQNISCAPSRKPATGVLY